VTSRRIDLAKRDLIRTTTGSISHAIMLARETTFSEL
jgi:hypothetical protein